MLSKLPATLCPLRKDLALVKAGTEHNQKKLRQFQTISFRITMTD